MIIAILLTIFSLKNFEKNIDDFLSPYYRYLYAKIDFNKAFLGKQFPLLRIAKPTSDEPDSWPNLTSLNNSEDLAFIIYLSNSNFIYEAVNTKLSLLQNDAHHFTATVWADNAKPVSQKIEIVHNCSNPVFTHVSNNWYYIHVNSKQSIPMPFNQTGLEVLKSAGITLGDLPGMYVGPNNFVVKFNFTCPDATLWEKRVLLP